MRIADLAGFSNTREAGLAKLTPNVPRISVGLGTCGSGNGAEGVYSAFKSAIDSRGLDVRLASVGCFGYCAEEPLVNVRVPGQPLLMLRRVQPEHVDHILDAVERGHLPSRELVLCKIEEWDHLTGHVRYGAGYGEIPTWDEVPFFSGQLKIVLRNCGLISPDDIEEYIAVGGYEALYKVLIDQNPGAVIENIKAAKLRGRGGAGFLTGIKWEFLASAPGPEKYLICNADEGDPGAYMNRNEIESDPHALLEGMLIAAFATGASQGIVYVRAEYPHRGPAPGARHRAGSRVRHPGPRRPWPWLRLRHRDGRGGRRLRLRRGDRADRLARGQVWPAASAPALPRAAWPLRGADEHQQRRDLVQRGAHRGPRTGLVQRYRQCQERGHQGLLAGGQGPLHGPRGDAPGHAPEQVHLRRRRRRAGTARDQGRADRRAVGRLHPGRSLRHPRRLRDPRRAGLHHGLGRHGRDGRRQLHGRRGPLLHRVHALRIVRQVRALPGGAGQGPRDPRRLHPRHGVAGGHRQARRALPHDPRHVAVRPGPECAQPGAHHPAPLPPRVRGPHPAPPLPRRRVRGPRAQPLRELVPAAHEHPPLPAAVQGGPAGGGLPQRRPGQPAAGLDRARLPAPLRRPLPARGHR